MYDALVLITVGLLWVTQPPHLRQRDVASYVVIVLCIKSLYFLDGQRSMNFDTDKTLLEYKIWLREQMWILQAVPLVLCIFLENKISRHYRLGKLHTLLSHSLTAMLIANFVFTHVQRPEFPKSFTPAVLAKEKEYAEFLALIGKVIYLSVVGFSLLTIGRVKFMQGKTWDNVSVRVGLFAAKAAMLVAGNTGPLTYFFMLLELYNFSLIINHRNDSMPGATFPIQMFGVVFIMQQFFLRSNHRERIDSIAFGKVCPGGVYCGELLHWSLILLEILSPYIIGLMLLPLVAKARVMHTHASIKREKSIRLARVS